MTFPMVVVILFLAYCDLRGFAVLHDLWHRRRHPIAAHRIPLPRFTPAAHCENDGNYDSQAAPKRAKKQLAPKRLKMHPADDEMPPDPKRAKKQLAPKRLQTHPADDEMPPDPKRAKIQAAPANDEIYKRATRGPDRSRPACHTCGCFPMQDSKKNCHICNSVASWKSRNKGKQWDTVKMPGRFEEFRGDKSWEELVKANVF